MKTHPLASTWVLLWAIIALFAVGVRYSGLVQIRWPLVLLFLLLPGAVLVVFVAVCVSTCAVFALWLVVAERWEEFRQYREMRRGARIISAKFRELRAQRRKEAWKHGI